MTRSADTGKIIRVLEGHGGHALSVAWSHDGHTLASTGARRDNTLRFLDAETGERRRVVEGFEKEVTGVCFVGDDVCVAAPPAATEKYDSSRIMPGATADALTPARPILCHSVAASADGRPRSSPADKTASCASGTPQRGRRRERIAQQGPSFPVSRVRIGGLRTQNDRYRFTRFYPGCTEYRQPPVLYLFDFRRIHSMCNVN